MIKPGYGIGLCLLTEYIYFVSICVLQILHFVNNSEMNFYLKILLAYEFAEFQYSQK